MKPFNLEEYLKNPNKKVVTREGRSVTILCTNFLSSEPIVAEIKELNCSMSFDTNGRHSNNSISRNPSTDLFFASEKHKGYAVVHCYNGEYYLGDAIYFTKEEADNNAEKWNDSVSVIKIEWEE